MKWTKVDWLNTLERAGWTFLEGFIVALPSAISLGLDGAAWKAALFSALCAGLSALKTVVLDVVRIRLEMIQEQNEQTALLEQEQAAVEDTVNEIEEVPVVDPFTVDDQIIVDEEGENDASV